jgi:hypothetical protein
MPEEIKNALTLTSFNNLMKRIFQDAAVFCFIFYDN